MHDDGETNSKSLSKKTIIGRRQSRQEKLALRKKGMRKFILFGIPKKNFFSLTKLFSSVCHLWFTLMGFI